MYEEDYLAFFFGDKKFIIHMKNAADNNFLPVHRADFVRMVEVVKKQCTDVAVGLISDLKWRFPSHEVMNALGMRYPQFLRASYCESLFYYHLDVLKTTFCLPKQVAESGRAVPTLLDECSSNGQASFFKLTMMHIANAMMKETNDLNPVTRM